MGEKEFLLIWLNDKQTCGQLHIQFKQRHLLFASVIHLLFINPTNSVQKFTCYSVCNGAEELDYQPSKTSEIRIPCWNPSSYKEVGLFKTCKPINGMCSTTTWQYKTTNGLKVTSYWVGIKRGCQQETNGVTWVTHGQGFPHSTNRNAAGMTQFLRYYMAADSEVKARENTQYPDAGRTTETHVGTKPFAFGSGSVEVYDDASSIITMTDTISTDSNYQNYGYITNTAKRPLNQMLTRQFMSTDGNGSPDLPTMATAVSELECLSCLTPLQNSRADDVCVTGGALSRPPRR